MPKAKSQKYKSCSQPELIAALTESGYELDGFSRKGDTLVVRLTPAEDLQPALDVCQAMNLQARCNVFAAVPQNLLILSVCLPAPQASSPKPKASSSHE